MGAYTYKYNTITGCMGGCMGGCMHEMGPGAISCIWLLNALLHPCMHA